MKYDAFINGKACDHLKCFGSTFNNRENDLVYIKFNNLIIMP